MKYFRDANLYRAVITVHNLVPRVFWLFGQLKPEDSGYERVFCLFGQLKPEDSGYEIALSTSLNSVFSLATKAEAVLVFPFSVALSLRKANFASQNIGLK